MMNRFADIGTSEYRPYPAYKDSGVEWLGEIPAHWEVTRADSLFRYEKIQVEPSTISEQSVFHYSIPAIQETGDGIFESPTGIDSAKLRVFGRRILVSKLNPRKGVVLIADEKPVPTICSTEFVPLEIRSCDLGWAYHLLASEPTRQRLSAVVRSATRSHQRAEIAEVLKMWHGVPPLPEQRAIAAFLDRETAKIDALVAKKERLIELLQEKRTALISDAVTKGLDPDAPLKDSGVEWLGEIPAHWEVKRLKYAATLNPAPTEARNRGESLEVSFVPMEAIGEYGGLELTTTKLVGEVYTGYTYFREGDVVVAKITPCFENGKGAVATGLVNEIAFGTTELHVLRVKESIDRQFLFYLSMGDTFRRLGEAEMYGAGGQKRVPDSFIKNLMHPLPPLPEQRAIAAFLDRETAQIDALVAKVREAIDRLKELRTALISAAVTGKIDVREAAE